MNRSGRVTRSIIGIFGLFVIFMLVMNYWSDYRSAEGGGGSSETTGSTEPTATPGEEGAESEDGSTAAGTVVVLTDGLKFRAEASSDSEMIGQFKKGNRVDYLGTQDEWYKVRTDDGKVGYVSNSEQYTRLEQ